MKLVPALLLLLTLARPAFAAWTITPYDPAPNGGWGPSLRIGPGPFVDGTGLPNIAYWSPGSGFHYYDGVSTQSAQPPLAASAPGQIELIHYGEAALALDFGGQPFVAEADLDSDQPANNTLTIAHRDNGAWTFESMGQTDGLLSIEYDGWTGKLHLLHRTGGGMVYAWREAGTWHTEPFGPGFGVLKLDHAGNPAVAYADASGLHYATRSGNSWQSVLVEGRAGVAVPALAFNSQGRPRIVYGYSVGTNPGDYFLRYATESNGTWTTEPVAAAGGSVYDYDLAMLGDVPYVAFQGGASAFFATKGASGWSAAPVDPQAGFGQYPTIVIDNDYRPIIAYQASSYGARYATGSQIVGVSPIAPVSRIALAALNVPAPRGSSIALRASVREAGSARLEAFDASGRSVAPPSRVDLVAGPNLVSWSAPSRPGLVFLRLVADNGEVATTRAVIL